MTVNYDQIAVRYDAHRPSGSDLCFDRLAEALTGSQRILEIGAGTGNTTRFVAQSVDATLVAMEPSAGMSAQARAKGVGGVWVRGGAPHLPFGSGCFDAVYSTYVLQHLGDPSGLFQACARVLRPNGQTAHITVPGSYIADHPLNHYFPSFARIDLSRFLSVEVLVAALENAGFTDVRCILERERPKALDRAYLARVESKFLSTFDIMSAAEYETGLERFRQDVEAGGGTTRHVVTREAVLIQARHGLP
jgi:ubiquinone/menaquinone biosynthesis C-methylase UbiE